MTRHAARCFADSLIVALVFVLSACSGAVSGPPAVTSGAITVTPSNATVYSDLPSTFLVSGGSGAYSVTSDNQAVIASLSSVSAGTFTVVPSSVGADTSVNLTVRDSSGSAPATVALTVKPRTVSNTVTITPSAGQSVLCGTSLCSGGDAEVKVMLSQSGVPLMGRVVQFEVVSGDLRIISSPAGTAETLAITGTAVTDASGVARIRVRALPDTGPETALLRVIDVSSGFVQSVSVAIALSTSSGAPLSVQPARIQFTGPDSNTCASGVSADVLIIGGRAPYQVTQPAGFTVNPLLLTTSGRVTITANGQCARTGSSVGNTTIPDAGQTVAIIDAAGASASVTVHNDPAPVSSTAVPPFDVAPADVTLDSCAASANVSLVGGTGSYFGAGSSAISVTASGNQGLIQRRTGSSTSIATATVAFSDGQTNRQVTVHLTGTALGPC